MIDAGLSLLVLLVLLLAAGSVAVWRRGMRMQAALMLVLALVMAANVAIWVVPVRQGAGGTLLSHAAGQ
ncbi:MAG TPA: hypothetical protein VN222_02995 [Novosphingobium sp.]|nr:hypothetical protein [Novosphingobium sp.]